MERVLPHSWQNPRSAYRDDLNFFGFPDTQVNASAGKCTKLRQGAPECFRQSSQWQITHLTGAAVALYRIAPHRHPPSYVSVIVIALVRPNAVVQARLARPAGLTSPATALLGGRAGSRHLPVTVIEQVDSRSKRYSASGLVVRCASSSRIYAQRSNRDQNQSHAEDLYTDQAFI